LTERGVWQYERDPIVRTADLATFPHAVNQHRDFFNPARRVLAARAPGRLDLMGGIADYSGALVLQLPLACATWVAVQPADEAVVTLRTEPQPGFEGTPEVAIPLDELLPAAGPLTYNDARCRLALDARSRWAAYVAGVLVALHREHGVRLETGLRVLIASDVPLGKGVSSSAALEVATLQAVAALQQLPLDGRTQALLCQTVENRVVGAPCGVMDQMTAACGERDALLALLCQPAELQGNVPLPPGLGVWGIDSGIRHAVSGADYSAVRVAAFMGYRIIAGLTGLPVHAEADGRVVIDAGRFSGYLANVGPEAWEQLFRARFPETMTGADFLERYGGITDTVAQVEPHRRYAIRTATAHPIYEHARVQRFADVLLAGEPDDALLRELGELMYGSHASYSACGLGSDGTDRLVKLVQSAGPERGLYGAKITGGGSGGTVAVLGTRHSYSEVRRIANTYERETGRKTTILGGSSPGAVAFGVWGLVHQ
jgi:L-arabinokinase